MKRLLLIGHEGMLGSALFKVLAQLHTVATLDRSQFDILRADWNSLNVSGFDYVLNAAGLINRRQACAEDFYTVNSVFPHVLSALCARSGARLIHFSTDCVFDGLNALYDESSARSATDLYGRSKALGEPNLALVIRTSIIGPEVKQFYNLLCWALSQTAIDGFTDHLWNGVTTLELARLVDDIISQSLFAEGVRHIFSNGCSKYALIKLICDSFDHKVQLIPVSAPSPRDTRLRTNFAEFHHSLGIRSLERQMTDLLPLTMPDGRWIRHRSSAA